MSINNPLNPLAFDLDHILDHTRECWEDLRGERLFLTGGTGFIGSWVLESFVWANDRLGLDAQAVVLTRDAGAFQKKTPHLAAHSSLTFHTGDIRSFQGPEGRFAFVVHAAAETRKDVLKTDPVSVVETIAGGTQRVLEAAKACHAKRFLLMSSGAVYGKLPPDRVFEDYGGAPDPMAVDSAYGEGKRLAEFFCAAYHRRYGLETTIARCFAFVGPYLPLSAHYAIGNFIRDGLQGQTIFVRGDGTPIRSYLYAADLAVWLWVILFRGKPGRPYNVGSEHPVSILETAEAVASSFSPTRTVSVAKAPVAGVAPEWYVPSTKLLREELKVEQHIGFKESIKRTVAWHAARPQ